MTIANALMTIANRQRLDRTLGGKVVPLMTETIANAWTTSHRVHPDPRLPC